MRLLNPFIDLIALTYVFGDLVFVRDVLLDILITSGEKKKNEKEYFDLTMYSWTGAVTQKPHNASKFKSQLEICI